MDIPDFDSLLNMLETRVHDAFTTLKGVVINEPDSDTIMKKIETEELIVEVYDKVLEKGSHNFPVLDRKHHFMFIHGFLNGPLPEGFTKLDASQPWITYWLMNSAILLRTGGLTEAEIRNACIKLPTFFNYETESDNKIGSFSGGYAQIPHLAASYAAILSYALTGNEELWKSIDVNAVKNFLYEMKQDNGSFTMQKGGEIDTRAVYCALCIASLLNILDDELKKGVKEWLISCQTFEGGFSGYPGDEAHGGYTFCSLAALFILLSPEELLESELDVELLIKWTVDRQYNLEGGFCGRTNKLVDGCYSHWVGGTCSLLEILLNHKKDIKDYISIIDRQKLHNYIICCCQDSFGLRDKPGCKADFYHTNYVLCGLSMCQYIQKYENDLVEKRGNAYCCNPLEICDEEVLSSKPINKVAPIDAIFGLPYTYAIKMHDFFEKL